MKGGPQGPRRSDPSQGWPWTAEYVAPGTGMVNFKAAFEYMKAIGFAGSFLHYSEYFVNVPASAATSISIRRCSQTRASTSNGNIWRGRRGSNASFALLAGKGKTSGAPGARHVPAQAATSAARHCRRWRIV